MAGAGSLPPPSLHTGCEDGLIDNVISYMLPPDSKIVGNSFKPSVLKNLHQVWVFHVPSRSYFRTLFCPIYVLDHCLQTANGPSPPKWEPRSRMGVYLGHSPFHAGSVALVFNPKTVRVSPQYHVIFDDDFTTVPYMERGKVPPNWEELSCLSTKSATDESVDLALKWM
jgi:hypothetical protein